MKKTMNSAITTALTGAAITMAVGTAAYVINSKSGGAGRKNFKKNAGKAVRAVGGFIDNVSSMIG